MMKRCGTLFVSILTLLNFGFSWRSQSPNTPTSNSSTSQVQVYAHGEKENLISELRRSGEVMITTINSEDIPVVINRAAVKAVKRTGAPAFSDGSLDGQSYAISVSLELVNKSSAKIANVGLRFSRSTSQAPGADDDEPLQNTFDVTCEVKIDPSQTKELKIPLMAFVGDPAVLAVNVFGVRFTDGTASGSYPQGPQGSQRGGRPQGEPVDSKPVLLNRMRPQYTEEARLNKVNGEMALSILVTADGTVSKVKVRNALPDGLTAEAERCAFGLRFKPAMRGGGPVDYWLNIELSFSLR